MLPNKPSGMAVERITLTRTTRRLLRPARTIVEYWTDEGDLLAAVEEPDAAPVPEAADGDE
jgi:hypothetical protein